MMNEELQGLSRKTTLVKRLGLGRKEVSSKFEGFHIKGTLNGKFFTVEESHPWTDFETLKQKRLLMLSLLSVLEKKGK